MPHDKPLTTSKVHKRAIPEKGKGKAVEDRSWARLERLGLRSQGVTVAQETPKDANLVVEPRISPPRDERPLEALILKDDSSEDSGKEVEAPREALVRRLPLRERAKRKAPYASRDAAQPSGNEKRALTHSDAGKIFGSLVGPLTASRS